MKSNLNFYSKNFVAEILNFIITIIIIIINFEEFTNINFV